MYNNKGYFGQIRAEHELKNSLSLVAGIDYLRFKNRFALPYYKFFVSDVSFKIDNQLTVNSINIPIEIKFKSKKKYYSNIGGGINYNFYTKRYSQIIATYINYPNKTDYQKIADEKVNLNKLNLFYKVGIGRELTLCSKKLWIEINFWSQINKQNYGIIKDYSDESYKFRNRMISLSLGFYLK